MEENTVTTPSAFATRSEHIDKLCQKIVETMASIKAIGKNGYNELQRYAYTEASEVFSIVRDAMASHKIVIFPSMLSKNVITRQNPNGKEIMVTEVTMSYSIVDVESSQYVTVIYSGEGMDSGDKGLPKALSICMKYYLRDQFLIPFGEDIENEKGQKDQLKTTGKGTEKPETNGKKQDAKQIEDHQRIACAMLKNMGFKEEAEQVTALQHIVQDSQIHAVSDLSRDHMFKFYQAMETLLGKKVDSGYKRTVEDYKLMRANYDKAMEVES
jgi:hypothetical protein